MIPFTQAKCEVPNCYKHLDVAIAERLKEKGKAAVCYDHRTITVEDLKVMYAGSGSTSKLGTST